MDLFHLNGSLLKEIRTETQAGWNLKAGTNVEVMEECSVLTFSSWFAHPDFL